MMAMQRYRLVRKVTLIIRVKNRMQREKIVLILKIKK